MTLPELIGAFLGTMRERACKHFDCDVDRVLLGRPARFSSDDREDSLAEERLGEAARIAGFRHVRFCAEPVAAAYDMAEQLREPKTVLIADLGGGTSDFTVVRLSNKGFQSSDILAVRGVSVAGDLIDGAIVRARVAPELGSHAPYRLPMSANVLTMPRELVDLLCSSADLTLLNRSRTLSRLSDIAACLLNESDREKLDRYSAIVEDGVGFQLFAAVEACKRRLSEAAQAYIELDYPGAMLDLPVARQEMESDAEGCVARIMVALDETLCMAGLTPEQIDLVCPTGGTARMPLIKAALCKQFPTAHSHALSSFHSVVRGLAVHARELIRSGSIQN